MKGLVKQKFAELRAARRTSLSRGYQLLAFIQAFSWTEFGI